MTRVSIRDVGAEPDDSADDDFAKAHKAARAALDKMAKLVQPPAPEGDEPKSEPVPN